MKKNLNRLEINISAQEKADETIDFSMKVDAACNLPFLANAFAHLLKEDESIRAAISIALLDSMMKEEGATFKGDIESYLKKNKPQAQA